MSSAPRVEVVAGVMTDADGRVLLARRVADAHQGGLWEFPGGKREPGEDAPAALEREFAEELGVAVEAARPLIRVAYDYPDRSVLLDVWRITRWRNPPRALENQEIEWVPPEQMQGREFPLADTPIVAAVRLPERYAITPSPGSDQSGFLHRLETLCGAPRLMLQLRAHDLDDSAYARLAEACLRVCRQTATPLILNREPEMAAAVGAQGVHLTSRWLMSLSDRPLDRSVWVGASCHDEAELRHAQRIGVDFAVLSPVRPTPDHAARAPLGWSGFRRLTENAGMPVYALGGVGPEDLECAWAHGAQGVAGIRGFWSG